MQNSFFKYKNATVAVFCGLDNRSVQTWRNRRRRNYGNGGFRPRYVIYEVNFSFNANQNIVLVIVLILLFAVFYIVH